MAKIHEWGQTYSAETQYSRKSWNTLKELFREEQYNERIRWNHTPMHTIHAAQSTPRYMQQLQRQSFKIGAHKS